MKQKRLGAYWRGSAKNIVWLSVAGVLAGFFNGLLGAGGGIILALTLTFLLPDDSESVRSVYSNALLVMLPLSALTLTRYISGGALMPEQMGGRTLSVMLGAMVGGVVGGILLGRLRGRWLKRIFACLTLVSGIMMLTR